MPGIFQKQIEDCRQLLLLELDVSEKLVSILFQDGILSGEQRDYIFSISRARKRRQEFLKTLINVSYKKGSPFEVFLKSLKNSDQVELIKKLKNPEECSKTFQNKKQDVELKLKVRKCFVKLIENMDLKGTCLLELFMQEGILNEDDLFVLNALPPTEKARIFLSILEGRRHRGNSPYHFFLKALQKDQDYLAKAIKDTTITDEDFNEYESKLFSCLS